jgi:hypothetical protein
MNFYYLYNPNSGEYRRYNTYEDASCLLEQLDEPWEGVYSPQQLSERLHEKKQRRQEGLGGRMLRNAGAGSGRTSTRIYRR